MQFRRMGWNISFTIHGKLGVKQMEWNIAFQISAEFAKQIFFYRNDWNETAAYNTIQMETADFLIFTIQFRKR